LRRFGLPLDNTPTSVPISVPTIPLEVALKELGLASRSYASNVPYHLAELENLLRAEHHSRWNRFPFLAKIYRAIFRLEKLGTVWYLDNQIYQGLLKQQNDLQTQIDELERRRIRNES